MWRAREPSRVADRVRQVRIGLQQTLEQFRPRHLERTFRKLALLKILDRTADLRRPLLAALIVNLLLSYSICSLKVLLEPERLAEIMEEIDSVIVHHGPRAKVAPIHM